MCCVSYLLIAIFLLPFHLLCFLSIGSSFFPLSSFFILFGPEPGPQHAAARAARAVGAAVRACRPGRHGPWCQPRATIDEQAQGDEEEEGEEDDDNDNDDDDEETEGRNKEEEEEEKKKKKKK